MVAELEPPSFSISARKEDGGIALPRLHETIRLSRRFRFPIESLPFLALSVVCLAFLQMGNILGMMHDGA